MRAALFAALLSAARANATPLTLFVAPNGSDSASGLSPATPFATLARAFAAASGGATVLLAGGVYERTAATLSASAGPVSVQAADPSAPAILSGGARVSGWARRDAATFAAPLPAGVLECTLLCERGGAPCRPRARTPDAGSHFTWASPLCPNPHSSPACAEADRWGLVFQPGDVSPALYDLTRVEVSVFGGWTASRHRVSAVFSENSTLLFQNPTNMPIGTWANQSSEGGGRYFLDNVREGLDAAGEFYCDIPAGEVLYRPLAGEIDPAALDLYLAIERTVVWVSNTSNVTLAGPGLVVAHSAWSCDFAGAAVCDWQSTSWQDYAAIRFTNASFVTVTGVEVAGVGGAAVWLDEGTHDAAVLDSYLHDLAAGGVRVAGGFGAVAPLVCQNGTVARINVTGNVIGRGGLVFPDGTGIFVAHAANVTIAHNEIGYFSFSGVSLGWCWSYKNLTGVGDMNVFGNDVHDLGTGAQRLLGDAMACFYSLGPLAETHVHHNVCRDVAAYYTGGFGTSQDQASSGYHFHDNVVVRTTGAGVNQHYGVGNSVYNNIVVDSNFESATSNNRGSVRSYAQSDLPSTYNFTRNIVYQTNASASFFSDVYMPYINIGGSAGGPPGHGIWTWDFADNVYYNTGNATLPDLPVWGGSSVGEPVGTRYQLTLAEWQRGCGTDWMSGATPAGRNCSGGPRGPAQDVRSVFADPLFADAAAGNFTLLPGSPALGLGFEPVDVSRVGPAARTWPPLTPP